MTSVQPLIDAVRKYYESENANIHRGIYTIAEEATQAYEGSRRKIARFIGASDPATVIFTTRSPRWAPAGASDSSALASDVVVVDSVSSVA